MRPVEIITIQGLRLVFDPSFGSVAHNAMQMGRASHHSITWRRPNDNFQYVYNSVPRFWGGIIEYGYEIDGSMLYGSMSSDYHNNVFMPFIGGEGTRETLMLPNEFHKLRNKS